MTSSKNGLLFTSPHSGERIPAETPWLAKLPETLLMYDVDRFVDRLYEKAIAHLKRPFVRAEWHRYACDLNRFADDIDCESVEGHPAPKGTFPRGLHWSITTTGEKLMPGPMPRATHDAIVKKYFEPFHEAVQSELAKLKAAGAQTTYHVDLHSMPSVGAKEHRDPGESRAQIVIGDCEGKSCSEKFKDLVTSAYEGAGFKTAYNWPYKGGRLTEAYGKPASRQHAIQVELNRATYMDEKTKQILPERFADMQLRLGAALRRISEGVDQLS